MDPAEPRLIELAALLARLYSLIFWFPAITNVIFLKASWDAEAIYGKLAALAILWFLVALYLQVFARSPAMWAAGLVMQVALAVVLIIRWKID